MKPLKDRGKDAYRYILFFIVAVFAVTIYQGKLRLLFAPDPPIDSIYQYSFAGGQNYGDGNIIAREGFIASGQGLELPPGASGKIVFQFEKQAHQGCLLRVWFYGDRGDRRPNAITIYPEGGAAFRLAGSGNYIGSVFDISEKLRGRSRFKIYFEAENRGAFQSRVLDAVELVTGQDQLVKPALPNIPAFSLVICIAYVILISLFTTRLSRQEKLVQILLISIFLLALYLRWHELERISGTMLDDDARGYYNYAQKMQLGGERGFYSAQFEKREPLFILMVKLFFALFGASVTHLRFVSCAFSLACVYITYKLGREWFHAWVGLVAAGVLAIHPYLIQLSARGLREEFFTVLLLLFIYFGYVIYPLHQWLRTAASGCIAGCSALTRTECLLMVFLIFILYPIFAATKWNYKMVLIALILCVAIWIPHPLNMHKRFGDAFFTANQYARFYANREFAGQPGFPSHEDIAHKGMYYGPKVTPIEYYFKYHSLRHLVYGSVIGFAKIYLQMPFSFITGRGNFKTVIYALNNLKIDPGLKSVVAVLKLSVNLFKQTWLSAVIGMTILFTFLIGLLFLGLQRYWMIFIYLILFQVHTSFLAFQGIDQRLTVHSYPLIAWCCGFCIWLMMRSGMSGRIIGAQVLTRC